MMNEKTAYSFLSKEGRKIWVRSLMSGDGPFLVSLFDHMTPESRYRRFNQSLDHVPKNRIWQEAESIAQADPQSHRGLIAFANHPREEHVPVGVVRIVALNENEAELAISIRDDYQNQGIGSKLVRLMTAEAQQHGFRKIVADIQNENEAILNVFNKLPYDVQRIPQGSTSDIIITLN